MWAAVAAGQPAPGSADAGAAEAAVASASADAGPAEAIAPAAPTDTPMAIEGFKPVAPMAVEAFGSEETPDGGVDALASTPALEAFEERADAPTVRLYGFAWAAGSVDTRFDSPPGAPNAENVAQGRARILVGADVSLSRRLRLVLEGRAQVRGVTQRDFARSKGFFEPMLGDAYLDVYSPGVDVRVGNQQLSLGANPGLAPADSLNPRDLRESLVAGDPELTRLPVFALRAQGEVGSLSWFAAYAPFFTPHRYFVFGQDEALLQPGLGPTLDNSQVDPSIEDALQERVLETRRPVPFLGDVALRLQSRGKVKLGASWVWMNEKLPRVEMDPELAAVGRAQAEGRPVSPALSASVANRLGAGETLYRGTYGRSHLFSLSGAALVGPGELAVDVAFTPRQTFMDPQFRPVDQAALTWVLGYSQASDSRFVYGVTYLGMAVPDVAAPQQLILLEPATAVGAARTAFFHLFVGLASYSWFDERLEVSLRAAVEPIQGSFAVGPKVSWRAVDGLHVALSAEFFEGKAWTPLGYFSRNDQVWLSARYELF